MKIGDRVEISKLGHCFSKLVFDDTFIGEIGTVTNVCAINIIMFKLDSEFTSNDQPYAGCQECLVKIKEVKK